MAIRTLSRRNCVRIGQGEPVRRMIELRALPAIHAVALFATGRDLAGCVVWHRGLLDSPWRGRSSTASKVPGIDLWRRPCGRKHNPARRALPSAGSGSDDP